MRDLVGRGLRRRGLMLLLLAAAALVPATTFAQTATAKRRSPCTDCEAEVRRSKALERLDSLRWEFEHGKLSDVQRERLGREMTVAMRELQAAIGALRAEMGDIERAQAKVWAAAPRVAYAYTSRPSGYLGVSFDGPNTEEHRGGERIIRFYAYPKISLVEPSSPAERAGVRVGDTLLTINGVDVLEREISLTRILVPDELLQLRLRREGTTREFKVTVGRAPAYVVQRLMSPPALAPTGAHRPTVGVWVYSDGVAGAKVETVTEGLAKALGVSGGVLILRAGPGTPASRAGLRDGDVIVRAAGVNVRTVRDLFSAIEQNDEGDGVKLVIMRERRQREVTLRQ